jgi:tetratricopeptide (TPR) repeat protein
MLMNAQVVKMIPVTTSSEKAMGLFKLAYTASEDIDIPKFNKLSAQVLAEDPDFFMINYLKAIYAAYFKQENNFVKYATKAVDCKQNLSDGELIMKDAIIMLLKDRNSDLTPLGKKLVKMYPEDINSYWHLATYQYFIKDYDGEISTINNALKLSGRKDYLYNSLAYAYMAKGQLKEAEANLDKYISLSPNLPNAYDSKGDLYMMTKEYKKAYENFMKANSIDSTWSKNKMVKAKSLAEAAPKQ